MSKKATTAVLEPVSVTEWIHYDDVGDREQAVGGMGGWFGHDREAPDGDRKAMWESAGHRWRDYIKIWVPEVKPYLEALRADIVKRELRLTGEQHQQDSHGIPVFSDGKVATFSWRGWGDLMAAVWSEEEDKNYNYMDFYM